jgi:hypothetical protein
LQRVEVRSERNDDVFGGDEGGPVDGTEIRADVEKHELSLALPCCLLDHPPHGQFRSMVSRDVTIA